MRWIKNMVFQVCQVTAVAKVFGTVIVARPCACSKACTCRRSTALRLQLADLTIANA